jgi:hypothetical protein
MRCDWCGRFGAKKYVENKGPNGHGGRQTYTYYECMRCTTIPNGTERPKISLNKALKKQG